MVLRIIHDVAEVTADRLGGIIKHGVPRVSFRALASDTQETIPLTTIPATQCYLEFIHQ